MELGTAIRRIRINLGIKQEELAAALDVSQSYLSKVESNKSKLYVDDLVRIAEYTNTPLINFFTEEMKEEPSGHDSIQRNEILNLLKEQNRYLQLLVDKKM
ncbi:helix-turn-helix domain-containing protein [[Flexibacter] sp. ATCC 35208]|uniref:helix-turn-helix domain-containing protein n=1 Tax=[Flexibacter] sp. ATCC 35208 TaxID=1936242 RepID=UPI0009D0E0EB|nr:helix-turn-helix transcriptional regulator [[Flexibacter] sp. ATCC 35208]OMP77248.1 hypothetical protein BW716_20730 [[Flexibacter] sp. ATCC 35208]